MSTPPPAPVTLEIDLPLPAPGSMGPPEAHARLRRECPVAGLTSQDGPVWYVTRYADVRRLLADGRLIRPTVDSWPPGRALGTGNATPGVVTMMEMDGPQHLALRRALADSFSAGAIRRKQPLIRRAATRVLDAFAALGAPGDLVAGFTEPFPLLVMCELTGIPYEDQDRYLAPADAALGALLTLEEARAAAVPLRAYLAEVIAAKRRTPGDDMLSHLVRLCDESTGPGGLTEESVVNFGLSMLVAGFRTTTMFLGDAVVALLAEPDLYRRLRDDRTVLPAAVEELLRHLPVMNGNVVLVATEDFTLHGQLIRAGEGVVPVIAAANRDPAVFPEADRLVLDRSPNPHVAFGRGVHNCIGAHLARAEMTVALDVLLDRFPHLRHAEGASPTWDDASPIKSPLTLPVCW